MAEKIKKVFVISGTRAEYGLLKPLIELLIEDPAFKMELIVTGMHLSKKFGLTYKEIEQDNIPIHQKINIDLKSDAPEDIAASTAKGVIKFSKLLNKNTPDIILVLGDRFEIYAAVLAATFLRIPVAHIHGGEITEGCIDEGIRHSITKLSHLHFVATNEYKKRVIQLGESPKRVFNVGGMGVDAIQSLNLMKKEELENSLNLEFREKNMLVTFHPSTLEINSAKAQAKELLKALSKHREALIIFTMPNADMEGSIITSLINQFTENNINARAFKSMGQKRYLSCINEVDVIIGNSSSGILEAPTFKRATINIGDRQKGRVQAKSIINVPPISLKIDQAIKRAYSNKFQSALKSVTNPYGMGGASKKIISKLKNTNFDSLLKKGFYDVNY